MNRLHFLLSLVLFVSNLSAVELTLGSGWNLFAPVLAADQSAQEYFEVIGLNPSTDISKVWSYNPDSGWTKFVPGEDNSTGGRFDTLKVGGGYWVFMKQTASVTLSDDFSSYGVDLTSGWNLVGLGSSRSVPIDVENFLSDTNFTSGSVGDIRKIWGYEQAGGWKSYNPTGNSNLSSLEPGFGYWFFNLSDLEINSQNVSLSDLFPPTCPGCPTIGN